MERLDSVAGSRQVDGPFNIFKVEKDESQLGLRTWLLDAKHSNLMSSLLSVLGPHRASCVCQLNTTSDKAGWRMSNEIVDWCSTSEENRVFSEVTAV